MRLITFLGTGGYEEVMYEWEGTPIKKTRYVQAAIASKFDATHVTVIASEKAQRAHRDGLSTALAGRELMWVDIPDGKKQEELWEIFEKTACALEAGDTGEEVGLDITHGFRTQPIFAIGAVSFLTALDPKLKVRIFYGAFETADREDLEVPRPIWELSDLVLALQFAQSGRLMLETGRGTALAALIEKVNSDAKDEFRGAGNKHGEWKERGLGTLGSRLEEFSQAFDTLRVGALLLHSGRGKKKAKCIDNFDGGVAWRLHEEITRLLALSDGELDAAVSLPPITRLLKHLQLDLKPLADGDNVQNLASADGRARLTGLARRYKDTGRVVEAMTVIREGALALTGGDGAARPVGEPCFEEEIYKKGYVPESIGSLRNDLTHCGFRKDFLAPKKLLEGVDREFEVFKAIEKTRPAPARSGVLNFSGSPSASWNAKQLEEAEKLGAGEVGEVVDRPLPDLDKPDRDLRDARAAIVGGEPTRCYALVAELMRQGVPCYALSPDGAFVPYCLYERDER